MVKARDINSVLHKMRSEGKLKGASAKGDHGEEAVLMVCLNKQDKWGGLVYHSFKYPYGTRKDGRLLLGNIYREDGVYKDVTKECDDEIDVLFITPYRVFAIEVKAYHAESKSSTGKGKLNGIRIEDDWMYRDSKAVDKSPIAQAEKHARHLYKAIYEVLPDGQAAYIVPIVVFVDKCDVQDARSEHFKNYIPVCILNTLSATLNKYNTPLKYNIDLEGVKRALKRVKKEVKQEFV